MGCRKSLKLTPVRGKEMYLYTFFIMVVALISRKISMKDILRKGMYANDLAIIADKKQELQELLEEWKGVFKKQGPIMSRKKTEEMWV